MRGLTLRFSGDGGATRFVRLTLVERRGLLGAWHNVREARAERAAEERGLPSALGEGRMLSWRPLTLRDAEGLVQQRTRTLERIGYTVIHSSESERAPWAWLSDLVHRQLPRATPEPEPEPTAATPGPELVLDESEEAPGEPVSNPADLLGAFAEKVGLETAGFEAPTRPELAAVDLDALAPLLDQLVESEHIGHREVAKRWLELPSLVYELDPAMIERWLEEGRGPARLISPRLPAEGLALCGEVSLRRLQQRSRSPRVRQFASKWVSRLDA